jgi:predicted DCC family thiol-disulfide oxidoreductase YuxK
VSQERDDPLIVLYDEDCGFCRWALDRLLAWDRRRRLRSIPIQADEGQALLGAAGLPTSAHLDSWHVALPSGAVRSAGAAAPPVLEQLPGGGPLAALARRAPRLTDCAYRAVARNRTRLARLLRTGEACSVRR